MEPMQIKVKKLHQDAKVPAYAHEGDAGMDLFVLEDMMLVPGRPTKVRTGVAMEIPEGYAGLIWDRSGLSTSQGVKTLGGVIDSGYRGEVLVGMINASLAPYTVRAGEKVAQLLIQQVERAEILEVADLSQTVRGEGGFGSTGK